MSASSTATTQLQECPAWRDARIGCRQSWQPECVASTTLEKNLLNLDTSSAVPRKLYDREKEADELLGCFDRCVRKGSREVLLVTGMSGTGKTVLVNMSLKPAVMEKGGVFVYGKFDLLERTEQHYPVIQALSEFAQLVSQTPARLHGVQAALAPFRDTMQVLADLVPSLYPLLNDEDMVGEKLNLHSREEGKTCP